MYSDMLEVIIYARCNGDLGNVWCRVHVMNESFITSKYTLHV
jgi:hypothetical protein